MPGYSLAAPFGAPVGRTSLSCGWPACFPVHSLPYCPPRLALGVGRDRTGPNWRLGSSGAAFIGRGGFLAPRQVFQVTNHPQGQEHCAGIRGAQASLSTLPDEPDSEGRAMGVPNSNSAMLPDNCGNRANAHSHPYRALASSQNTEACGLASRPRKRCSIRAFSASASVLSSSHSSRSSSASRKGSRTY